MLNVDLILENDDLYLTKIDGYSFLWRLLSLKEYRVFSAIRSQEGVQSFWLYEKIFKHCYLGEYPLINLDIPAGLTVSIGQAIMWLSGDCNKETLQDDLEQMRGHYHGDEVFEVLKQIVLTALPSYTLEEIDTWNRSKLIRMFTFAESLLSKKTGYEPINFNTIISSDELKKKSNLPINVAAENRALRKALGPWDSRPPGSPGGPTLSPKQAQQLERMKRARSRVK